MVPIGSKIQEAHREFHLQMPDTLINFILPAMSFGLVAGLKPGPLGVLVIQQSLSNGFKAGARASLAPFVTDVPIIAAAFCFLSLFHEFALVIAGVSLFGGLYVMYLGYKIFASRKQGFETQQLSGSSFWMAVRLNFLNPGPYLFWFTVGGTYLVVGTLLQGAAFIAFSVVALVLSKMFVAFLSLYFRSFLSSEGYRTVMLVLALVMCIFGIQLLIRAYSFSEFGETLKIGTVFSSAFQRI